MDAALHDGYGDARDGAEDEVAGVAYDGGLGEVRDVGVGDGDGGIDGGGEVAEAGAEDDADARRGRGEGLDMGGGGLGSGVEVGGVRHGCNRTRLAGLG